MTERPQIEKRKPLTRKEYLSLCIDQLGRCGCGCGFKLDPLKEGVVDEHLIPLGVSGSNELKNRSLYRKPCAAAKTTIDRKDIAHVERIIAREEGTRRERQKIQGRGFQKDVTRGFDGVVRPRSRGTQP